MARVAAEPSKILVDREQFIAAFEVIHQLEFDSPLKHLNQKALLAFYPGLLVVCATDMNRELVLTLPCETAYAAKVVVPVNPESIRILKKLSGPGGLLCQVIENRLFVKGVPVIDKTIVSPDLWPAMWPQKDSITDIDLLPAKTLFAAFDAVGVSLPPPADGKYDTSLHAIHVARQKNGTVRFESTDGHRAHLFHTDARLASSLLIPPPLMHAVQAFRACRPLAIESNITFQRKTKNHEAGVLNELACLFQASGGARVHFVARFDYWPVLNKNGLVEAYPPIDTVIPAKKSCVNFRFCPRSLASMATNAITNAKLRRPNGEPLGTENAATIYTKENSVFFYHKKSDMLSLLCPYPEKADPLDINFNPFYMLDAARIFDPDTPIRAWIQPDCLGPLHLVGEQHEVLLMPMRK